MTQRTITDEYILQNLKGADCSPDIIELCMKCFKQDSASEQLRRVLSKQRCLLLDNVHDSQKKLDRLDHLTYQLKNKMIKEIIL